MKYMSGAEFMRRYRAMIRDMEPEVQQQSVLVKGRAALTLPHSAALPMPIYLEGIEGRHCEDGGKLSQ